MTFTFSIVHLLSFLNVHHFIWASDQAQQSLSTTTNTPVMTGTELSPAGSIWQTVGQGSYVPTSWLLKPSQEDKN